MHKLQQSQQIFTSVLDTMERFRLKHEKNRRSGVVVYTSICQGGAPGWPLLLKTTSQLCGMKIQSKDEVFVAISTCWCFSGQLVLTQLSVSAQLVHVSSESVSIIAVFGPLACRVQGQALIRDRVSFWIGIGCGYACRLPFHHRENCFPKVKTTPKYQHNANLHRWICWSPSIKQEGEMASGK